MTETKTKVYMPHLNTVTKIGTEMTEIETKDGIEIGVEIMIEVSCCSILNESCFWSLLNSANWIFHWRIIVEQVGVINKVIALSVASMVTIQHIPFLYVTYILKPMDATKLY